jgi:hypothetical protein
VRLRRCGCRRSSSPCAGRGSRPGSRASCAPGRS